MKTIPVSGMTITDKDKETMIYAISSGEISYGSYNRLASGRLATYDKLNFCHLVNSGSSANLLAMMAFTSKNMPKEYRVKKGDEIITVAASFPTTVAPIIQAGCVPVFVDIDDSYNIDVGQIYKAITPKTKGIFIAHTLGIPFDVVEIENICRRLGLFLIADNCDSLGTTCNNKPISVWGDVITHSFYPAHHITSGEGGAVLTNNIRIAKIIQSIRRRSFAALRMTKVTYSYKKLQCHSEGVRDRRTSVFALCHLVQSFSKGFQISRDSSIADSRMMILTR